MSVLVYAYGCAEPLEGLREAEEEMDRQRALWDACVLIERDIERQTLEAAAADTPELRDCIERIESLSRRMDDAEGDDFAELRTERRGALNERNRLRWAWEKAHKEAVRALELQRRERVKAERQASHAWWPNYNRVIGDYETARKAVRKFGRRLQLSDESEQRGVLTVQIQRTSSGLGAAPHELQNGTYRNLQIGAVDPDVYAQPRAKRTRGCRVTMEMRIDAAGNMLRIPVWLHRPLPECRVKLAQLIWRREGGRMRYRLCLTLSLPDQEEAGWVNRAACAVAFRGEDHGGLVLGVVADSSGPRETIRLDGQWSDKAKYCDHLKRTLQAEIAGLREPWQALSLPEEVRETLYSNRYAPPPYRLHEVLDRHLDHLPVEVREWRDGKHGGRARYLEWQNLRRKLIGHRKDQVSRIARDLASRYGIIVVPDTDLASAQRSEDREDWSPQRWSSLHEFRLMLRHQASKCGGRLIEAPRDDDPCRLLASGLVLAELNPPQEPRMSRHERRRKGLMERSQNRRDKIQDQPVTS